MANEFVYSQPVRIYFGEGKLAALADILEDLGAKRCVIACGKHFAPQAEKMREELEYLKTVKRKEVVEEGKARRKAEHDEFVWVVRGMVSCAL